MPESFSITDAISKLVAMDGDLSESEAEAVIDQIMVGAATPSQIAAFLTALRIKGASVAELTAFARGMRKHALKISLQVSSRLIDTCGTGGGKLKTFNISTIASFVIAGAGAPVAKHGNRSFTSRCGSADLLEKFGVNIGADPRTVQTSIEGAGIGFMFAPIFHPAMKHAALTRREIGIRTAFNILGPLTNPAGAKAQIVGVYEDSLVLPVARVLKNLGAEDVLVVHGLDGIDEISLVGRTRAARVVEDEIREETLEPSMFGLNCRPHSEISADGADIEIYVSTALNVLSRDDPDLTPTELATKEMVLMNSAAALSTSRLAGDYIEGMELAKESVSSGKALDKVSALVKYSNGDLGLLESRLKNSQKIRAVDTS